ncbi:hypothetical protein AcW1_010241 [Taiwanofungus camphoratus]|nr:hypothetical protein AcV7_010342 [Antrodia cinnamomea]KAI0963151.1 hypothetical protein AcW1_010241 [Antrodia cinnamomea]
MSVDKPSLIIDLLSECGTTSAYSAQHQPPYKSTGERTYRSGLMPPSPGLGFAGYQQQSCPCPELASPSLRVIEAPLHPLHRLIRRSPHLLYFVWRRHCSIYASFSSDVWVLP